MQTQFAHDLCVARKKAGLTQQDLSILLEIGSKEVAALETGAKPPSLEQMCRLSIIYNRSFTQIYQDIMQSAREALFRNLPDLPEQATSANANFNRDNTLKRLDRELTSIKAASIRSKAMSGLLATASPTASNLMRRMTSVMGQVLSLILG